MPGFPGDFENMIEYLDGILSEKGTTYAVVDCAGVGYFLTISLYTYEQLPEVGERVRLLVHLVHREDLMELYGFATRQERDLFRRLISVSRVGPRVAVAMLSRVEPAELSQMIQTGDVAQLSKLPKVGKKTAERIILELRGKIPETSEAQFERDETFAQAVDALEALGFSRTEAISAVSRAKKSAPEASVDELIKIALRR